MKKHAGFLYSLAGLIAATLALVLLAQLSTVEAADLIVPVGGGTDATADASYDDAWIESTYWMNGWDIWIDGDLVINATGSWDGNTSASLTVNGTITLDGTMNLNNDEDHYIYEMSMIGSTFHASSGTITIGKKWDGDLTGANSFYHHDGTFRSTNSVFGNYFRQSDTGDQYFYNFVLDASTTTDFRGVTWTVLNDLTINSGTFVPYISTYSMQVDGDTVINGGTLGEAAWSGSFTTDAIEIYSGATFWFSTTTTTIVGEYLTTNHGFYAATGSTVEGNGGTLVMDSPGTPEVTERGTGSIHHLQIDDYCGWVYALSITGDLTLNDWFKEQTDHTLTIGDDLIVNNGGMLFGSSWTAGVSCDDILIQSGGEIRATSGRITAQTMTNNAGASAWTHNEGELYLTTTTTTSQLFNSAVFWDVTLTGAGRHKFPTANDEVWIENNLDVTFVTGKYLEIYSTEFRFGTESQAATVTGDCYFYTNGAASQYVELWSISEDYPVVISMGQGGSGKSIDMWYFTSLKWVTIQNQILFNDATKTLKLDGDSTIEDLNLGASDIFNQQGYHLTVTGLFIPDGTYSHSTTAKLTIESGGNYTMVRNSEYKKLWIDGDLLTGGFDLTVTQHMDINATGNFWAEDGDVSLGESWRTNDHALMVYGDYFGGSGDHEIGCMQTIEGSRVWLTSGTTTFTSQNTAWFYTLYITDNDFYHSNGLVVFDRTHPSNTIAGITTGGYNIEIVFWDVIVEDYGMGPLMLESWYCKVVIENNLVIQSGAVVKSEVSGTIPPERTYFHVLGSVIVNGTLDLDLINADHEFGSLDVNGGIVHLSGGETAITTTAAGATITNSGTVYHNDGTIRVYNTGGANQWFLGMNGDATEGIFNFELESTSTGDFAHKDGDCNVIAGDLTVLDGAFKYYSTTHDLTVLGETTIDGGTLGSAGWTGHFETRTLTIESGSTYEGTAGQTELIGDAEDWIWVCEGTYNHNNGEVLTNVWASVRIITNDQPFYDFSTGLNSYFVQAWTDGFEVENNFMLNCTFRSAHGDIIANYMEKSDYGVFTNWYQKVTYTVDVTIDTLVVNGGSSEIDVDFDDQAGRTVNIETLIINSGAGFLAPGGVLQVLYFDNSGSFDANGGTVLFSGDNYGYYNSDGGTTDTTFYDLVNGVVYDLNARDSLIVENELSETTGRFFEIQASTATHTLTMGTASSVGTISADLNLYGWNANGKYPKVYGADSSYPALITGTISFDDWRSTNAKVKWLNIQSTITLNSGSGTYPATLTIDGTTSTVAITVTANDTLDLNGNRLDAGGAVTIDTGGFFDLGGGTLIGYDTLTIADDWGATGDQTDGQIQTQNGIAIMGNLTVLIGTTLDLTANTFVRAGYVNLEASSILEAPSGRLYIGQFFNSGSYIHNNGEVVFQSMNTSGVMRIDGVSPVFYDVRQKDSLMYMYVNIQVINTMEVTIWYSNGQTLTLGSDTQSGTVNKLTHNSFKVYAYSEDYYAMVTESVAYSAYSSGGYRMKWVEVQAALVDMHPTRTANYLALDGDCIFQSILCRETDSINLNGFRATINGTFTSAGTLTTGGMSSITITENGSWIANQNVTIHELEVDGSIEICSSSGCKNITFTGPGFRNSTGTINVTGSYGDLVYITGTPYWEINADAINYFWKYVNVSHGYNTGSSALVALGEGFDLLGPWDFQAPLITPHIITEGLFVDTRYTSILQLDWTAEDMSYLYALNITISDYLGSVIFTREINESTFGETAAYRWNLSVPIEDLSYGHLFINYTASDAHNPPASPNARKNADAMLCDLAGELVGNPSGKDKSDKLETNTIKFKKSGPFVSDLFDLEFLTDNKGSQHVVKWTGDNFKMSHWVKLDHGTSVPMRITANTIEHIPASEFGAAHFLINGDYFYDASDFEATGGKILLLDQGTQDGKEYITISFTHPDWKKGGGWGLIDPLTGAINSRSEFYNISVGTIPEVVIPNNNAKLPGDSTSTTLKVRVYGAGSFEGTVHFYDESGALLGSQTNVTNNTVAMVELSDLSTDNLYPWYTVLSVGGENFTSPLWSFRTGGLEAKSASPGSGRERYGDSTSPPMDTTTIVFFAIFITLIILITKLWIGGEVNKS